MASPQTSSRPKSVSGSADAAAAAAGNIGKSERPAATDQRPPTPPMSDTEPFPALDPDYTTTSGGSTAQGAPVAATSDDSDETPTRDSLTIHNAPSPVGAGRQDITNQPTANLVAEQQPDQDHLDVDIEPMRSQPSPVTPPYWSHRPSTSERRPALSLQQPNNRAQEAPSTSRNDNVPGFSSYASSESTVSPTSPRSSFDRYSLSRTMTSASIDSLMAGGGGGITLRDNENSSLDDRGSACWARSVVIRDYVIVNGGTTSIGAFVVWNVRVETLSVSVTLVGTEGGQDDNEVQAADTTTRYDTGKPYEYLQAILRIRRVAQPASPQFPEVRGRCARTPTQERNLQVSPQLLREEAGRATVFFEVSLYHLCCRVIAPRLTYVHAYSCIMLNPEFSGSPILKEFLFS